ncbi:hypothetical protein [Paenibacillus sedimenti]|uniref:Uncharacterized protein n=1 Tax=Paenibacillus sedimenti TaxID=2770274 RepID=A0A926QNF9_9BACL|nr:hypothetical protein [Paenibacillus sedimenti]MBD0384732.1 hypothetical protein [Paenibacillus sedimenti]
MPTEVEVEVLLFLAQKYKEIEDERKKKKEQQVMVEQIIQDITTFISNFINNMRTEQFKSTYESLVGYYKDMKRSTGAEGVSVFQLGCRGVLQDTENFIINRNSTTWDDILTETYLLYAQIVCFMAASYIELNELYGYELEESIIEIYEKNLKLSFDLERVFFNGWYVHRLQKNDNFSRVERWRSVYLTHTKNQMIPYRLYRDKLVNLWQQEKVNIDANFNRKSPEPLYGGFEFPRCSDFSIVEDTEDKTRRYLAVNDRGVKDPNISFASIIKDIPSNKVEKDTEVCFEVVLKSLKPGRKVVIAIYELRPSDKSVIENGEASSAELEIGEEWVSQNIRYRKQLDETSIRFEIYWYDREPDNLLIDKSYITLSKSYPTLETADTDYDTLYFWGWRSEEQRCRHISFHYDLKEAYRTGQYIYVHNEGGALRDPSIHQDSWITLKHEELGKEFVFEAFVKNEQDVTRKIQLRIWELDGGNLSPKDEHTETYEITNEWTRVQVRYKKQYPITFLRSEIYWFDQELAPLLIDNARLYQIW